MYPTVGSLASPRSGLRRGASCNSNIVPGTFHKNCRYKSL